MRITAVRYPLKRYLSGLFALVFVAALGVSVVQYSPAVSAACTDRNITISAAAKSGTADTVTVSWHVTNSGNSGLCSFEHWRVKYGLASSSNTSADIVNSNSATSHDVKGLKCGQTYNFWVVAEKSDNSNVSNEPKTTKAPTCPSRVVLTGFSAPSSTSVSLTWRAASPATGYVVHLNGASHSVTATHYEASATCNTKYTAYVVATASGQSGPASSSLSTTPACPPPSGGGSSGSGSAGSGSSGSSSRSGSGSSTGNSSAALAAIAPPSIPTDFAANLQSGKVVQLTWNSVDSFGGSTSYEIDRSTDNNTWTLLGTTGDASYKDTTTDFNATYYYRLKAIDTNGGASDYATTQITTGAFKASDSKLVSDDKAVTIDIPADAFSQQVDCSFDSSAADTAPTLPTDKLLLRGPYALLCVGADGSTLTTFDKPLKVVLNLPSGNYANYDVRQSNGDGWSGVTTKQDAKKKQLTFNLTSATFASFGTKQRSAWGTVFTIFMWLLLLVAGAFAVRWYLARRNAQAAFVGVGAADAAAAATAQQQFEEATLRPSCTHLNMAQQVQPQTAGCAECTLEHKHWKALRICLTCGHVGCSDDSDEQHARKHFEQTGHPLIYEYGNPAGDTIGWCYIDQTYI